MQRALQTIMNFRLWVYRLRCEATRSLATTVSNRKWRAVMQSFIRTALQNEVLLDAGSKERGIRYWSAVELPSRCWFVVEVCVDGPNKRDVKHFLALSIDEVKRIQLREEPLQWTQVFLGMRAPLESVNGVIFERLEEAHLNAASGQYVYKLASGLTFSVEQPESPQPGVHGGLSELRRVYRRR